MFKKGDILVITSNLARYDNKYFPDWFVGRQIIVSLKVDEGYEWLDENDHPWFVMSKDVRPLTKLELALK